MNHLLLAAWVMRSNADFTIANGGGIRNSIEVGGITYRDVVKVQPSGNMLTYTGVSGKEVVNCLTVVTQMKPDFGAYPQFANVSFVAGNGKLDDLKIRGEPMDPTETYQMVMLNFNATGGDGYPNIAGKPGYMNTGFVDTEVLKEYIERNSPLDAIVCKPRGEVSWQ